MEKEEGMAVVMVVGRKAVCCGSSEVVMPSMAPGWLTFMPCEACKGIASYVSRRNEHFSPLARLSGRADGGEGGWRRIFAWI